MMDDMNIGTPEPWTPLVEVQHELCVAIPALLLRIPPEDWKEFAEYLLFMANKTLADPEEMAYSVG